MFRWEALQLTLNSVTVISCFVIVMLLILVVMATKAK